MTLSPIRADNLTAGKHGFFTRHGGQSTGIYAGLNCGMGSNDDIETVLSNRAMVANAFDVASEHLMSVYQIHSADAVIVDQPFRNEPPKCDAMVTATKGLALGVLHADCAPVLFEDREAGVIGAAHSGWRGAIGGVLSSTVEAMIELGARRDQISAAVGPCISQRAYEVGPEFVEEFLDRTDVYSTYFAGGTGDRAMFDLPRFVLDRLRDAGITDVEWTGDCTYSDPDRFFSYRRSCHNNEPDYGRLISVIAI